MRVSIAAAAAVLVALCAPAWAINKCTGSDGKVAYQDAPCAGKGEKVEARPNSGLTLPKGATTKPPIAAEAPAATVLPSPSAPTQSPAKSALEQEADMCLAWYKPKLRDPAGAYYSAPTKTNRVLSITVHATNGFGGYVTKQAACEIHNSQLNLAWTKIHAQRSGWSVD